MKQQAVTGVKPTGTPHLGNYYGAMIPALELANTMPVRMFLADYHALTTLRNPEAVSSNTREIAASMIAVGLNNGNCMLYRQSDVPEVCELSTLLGCITAKGLLNRAHAYKAAVDVNRQTGEPDDNGIGIGLYTYPILMAADIIGNKATHVPVGADQTQHLEIAKAIVASFNAAYNSNLTAAKAVANTSMLIPGTDGRKMSKSYNNTIPMFAEKDEIARIVKRIATDSRAPEEPKNPDSVNIYALYKTLATKQEADDMAEKLQAGGIGYGKLKEQIVEAHAARFGDGFQTYKQLIAEPELIEHELAKNVEQIRTTFNETLALVRAAMGIRS